MAEARQLSPRRWALRLRLDDLPLAARLRDRAGVEALIVGDALWLRGEDHTAQEPTELALQGGERFELDDQGRLRSKGARLAASSLPREGWCALAHLVAPGAGAASMPAIPPGPHAMRLVEDPRPRPTALLLTELDALADWGRSASALRLAPLTFAASSSRAALVRGAPLPPVAGAHYWVEGQIALPAGRGLSPALDTLTLATVLALVPGDLALLRHDGSVETVPQEAWVALTRDALKTTLEQIA